MGYHVIIPARMASTRFPGKPLAMVNGVPLILRVLHNAEAFFSPEQVFVATDSESIMDVVVSNGHNAIMTSGECRTGTDRVAEAARFLGSEGIINLQGDEPLVKSEHMEVISRAARADPDQTHCCYAAIGSAQELHNTNVPKVVISEKGNLLYASRLPIPGYKNGRKGHSGFKQVCIYYFPAAHLRHFGPGSLKGNLEDAEDIEILRLLEKSESVSMHYLEGTFHAVDIPSDIPVVERHVNS